MEAIKGSELVIMAPTHLLDLTMELLLLTFVGLTHADLARVARVCLALSTAVGEARCSWERLSIEDIGQPAFRISSRRTAASLRGSNGSFDCAGTSQHETVLMSVARIAGADDPWESVPRILSRALLSLPNLLELRLSGLVGLTDACVSSGLTPALTHLPRLSVLDLSSTAVGTRGVLSLRTLARLEELLSMEKTSTAEVVSAAEKQVALAKAELKASAGIDAAELKKLKDAAAEMEQLKVSSDMSRAMQKKLKADLEKRDKEIEEMRSACIKLRQEVKLAEEMAAEAQATANVGAGAVAEAADERRSANRSCSCRR